ncbi:hypothetical protein D1007_06338 [Hordeum vulgare]|nr:hypothetical protein D1007_06338 [Hordeum vulgare]
MASSRSKALWDNLSPEEKRQMAAIVVGWQAGRQAEDDDIQMEDYTKDEPAQANQTYNLDLLEEYQCAEELLDIGVSASTAILWVVSGVPEQQALLKSRRSAPETRLDR